MRLGELKKLYKDSKIIHIFDMQGNDISNKSTIILDCMEVIGSEHNADGTMSVDVLYGSL